MVEDALLRRAELAANTVVAFDAFTCDGLESNPSLMRSIRASLSAGGEPLKFGIDSTPPVNNRMVALLDAAGSS